MPAQSTTDIDSTPRPRRRRRWIVALAALGLLIAIPCWVVWPIVRPLTDAERRLVGTWRNTTTPAFLTFHSDRTVTAPGHPTTAWFVRYNTLRTTDEFLADLVQSLFGRHIDRSVELTFEDDDDIAVFTPANGSTQRWQRVSTE